MCVVIDVNRFHELFYGNSYTKVVNSLSKSNGPYICYGGSKYRNELSGSQLKIIEQYSIINKTIIIDDNEVDELANKLIDQYEHKDFDDPHIIALCILKKCRLVISNDMRMKTPIEYFFKTRERPRLIKSDKQFDLIYNRNYRISM